MPYATKSETDSDQARGEPPDKELRLTKLRNLHDPPETKEIHLWMSTHARLPHTKSDTELRAIMHA